MVDVRATMEKLNALGRSSDSPGAFRRRLKFWWGYPQGFPCKHGGISDEAVESLNVLYLQIYSSGLLQSSTYMFQEGSNIRARAKLLTLNVEILSRLQGQDVGSV